MEREPSYESTEGEEAQEELQESQEPEEEFQCCSTGDSDSDSDRHPLSRKSLLRIKVSDYLAAMALGAVLPEVIAVFFYLFK